MRKVIIAATLLVGVGLVFFLLGGGEEPEASSPASPVHAADPKQAQAPGTRAGTILQPVSPEDVGARGTPDEGSTPTLAQAPSEADGVLDVEVVAGEKPVPGASVRLYWRGARDPNLGELSWRLASTGTTDAQGHARLASRPGGYQVAVHAQGYATLLRDVVRPYGAARTALRLVLQPGGQSLTGRTVVHGTKEPLPLVEIILTAHGRKLDRWQRPEAPAEERVYASSDERGNFRIEGLAAGDYLLEARAPGHARAVLRSVKVPSAEPLTVALQVAGVIEGFVVDAQGSPAAGAEVQVSGRVPQVVTTGQGGGFSVEVEAGIHTVSARRGDEAGSLDKPVNVSAGKTVRELRLQLGQGSVLEGRVVARSTGAPIAGASVDVSPNGSNGDSGRSMTDGTGRFSVGGLAPGSYDLAVSAPGFSSLFRRGLTVASGESFPLDIQLAATGAAEGRALNGAGEPVPGVRITGGNIWGGSLGSMSAEALTDAEGRYRLEGLAAGTVYLNAARDGVAMGTRQRVEVTEGATARADFTLQDTGTVEGVVRAVQGSLPAEPLTVTAFPPGLKLRFSPSDMARAEVDAAGRFRMELPAGQYGLHIMSKDGAGLAGRNPQRTQVQAGKTVQVELTWEGETQDSGALQGIVLEPDGSPSAEALVTLFSEGGLKAPRAMNMTDQEGRFSLSFVAREKPAPTHLRLTARNGGRSGDLLDVEPGEQQAVVRLRPAASVGGTVVRARGGAPVKGFAITLQPQRDSSFTPPSGSWEFPGNRFELRDVPSELVKLKVKTTDGAVGEILVAPDLGAMAQVEVVVNATAGVRGRVVDAVTKAPVAGAAVSVEGEPPSFDNPGTGQDGRFTLEGLSPGARTLLVGPKPFRPTDRRPVTLVEGQVLDVGDILMSGPPSPPGPSAP